MASMMGASGEVALPNPRVPDDSWFSVRSLDQDTWCISEPHHQEDGHFYLLRSRDGAGSPQALLLDCGLGVMPLCPLVEGLVGEGTPVSVALTHTHWDHIGGLGEYPRFLVHQAEADLAHPPLPLDHASLVSCVTEDGSALPVRFDLDGYQAHLGRPLRILRDGDLVRVGSRALEVVHTPGHSPGSACYLEPETGRLFCGDLLYAGPIYLHLPGCDPTAFARSVARVSELVRRGLVREIWPGHNRAPLPPSFAGRVARAAEDDLAGGKAAAGTTLDHGDFTFVL